MLNVNIMLKTIIILVLLLLMTSTFWVAFLKLNHIIMWNWCWILIPMLVSIILLAIVSLINPEE
jgi:hypothetical protein